MAQEPVFNSDLTTLFELILSVPCEMGVNYPHPLSWASTDRGLVTGYSSGRGVSAEYLPC